MKEGAIRSAHFKTFILMNVGVNIRLQMRRKEGNSSQELSNSFFSAFLSLKDGDKVGAGEK